MKPHGPMKLCDGPFLAGTRVRCIAKDHPAYRRTGTVKRLNDRAAATTALIDWDRWSDINTWVFLTELRTIKEKSR